jgi:3-hydroxyisobutyrate dehydrogenase-like beta-hydroxyacid dehydrogenase
MGLAGAAPRFPATRRKGDAMSDSWNDVHWKALSRPPVLGMAGLGLLGSAFAERAIAGGWRVAGFDPDPAAMSRLRTVGGEPVDSPATVVEQADRVLLVLPHDGVSREVLAAMRPKLRPGAIVLDATTGDPDAMAELGRQLAVERIAYLDATVSGSSVQVRAGDGVLMVGGPEPAFARCQELFQVLARQTLYGGECGNGARLKLVTNLVLGLNRAALAEGLVFADRLGVDGELALAALRAGIAYSRIMDTKGEKMLRDDFLPQAKLSQHRKDVDLMLTAAARHGQNLPLTVVHRELLLLAEELGFGEHDNSAVIQAVRAQPFPTTEKNRHG